MTMTMTWKALYRTGLLLSMAVLLTTIAAVAEEGAPPTEPAPGQLLVASTTLQDPRFYHCVVLLLRHDRTGAFGIIINHPIAKRPIAEVLAATGDKSSKPGTGGGDSKGDKDGPDAKVEGTIRVFLGGPVQPQLGFVVHSSDYQRPETLMVGDQLAMTANKEVLRDIAHHQGPAKYLFALGYAGWGAGQLEGEIARRDWFAVPAEPDLVFDAARDTVWEKAVARRTREL
jgi:putative transcriptional regulator